MQQKILTSLFYLSCIFLILGFFGCQFNRSCGTKQTLVMADMAAVGHMVA
jgi:hypothetical protein